MSITATSAGGGGAAAATVASGIEGVAIGSGDLSRANTSTSLLALVVPFLGLGGHSLFSLTSILASSLVMFDTALDVRGGVVGGKDACLFVCCSNLPMRFATL